MTLEGKDNTEGNENPVPSDSNTYTFVFDIKNRNEAEKLYNLLSTLNGVASAELRTPNYKTVNVICKVNDSK